MIIGRHTFEAPPGEIAAIVERAIVEDRQAEAEIKAGGNQSCLGCFVAFMGLAVMFGLLSVASGTVGQVLIAAVALPLAGVGLFLFFQGRKKKGAATPHDLDNQKLDMLQRVVRTLQADLPPEAPLRLEVDFRDPYQDEFLKAPGAHQQTWLAMAGRLVDRTAWRLSVSRSAKRKTKPKTKGRTKTAETFRDSVSLQVRVPPGRYADLSGLPPLLAQPPKGLQVARCQAAGDRVQVSLVSPPARTVTYRVVQKTGHETLVDPDSVLASLVWLFRGLRRLQAPGA